MWCTSGFHFRVVAFYDNAMSAAVICDLCVYADDSLLFISGENVKQIESALEKEINEICKWSQPNMLSLH